MILREYQEAAKAAFYDHLRTRDDAPCIVLPTGAGKTPLLASICRDIVRDWNGRVLVLAHVRELLSQAVEKIIATDPTLPVGVYSAGLKKRERSQPITIAGIQSIFRRATDFEPWDVILIDEAHLIQIDGDGMYQSFLKDCKTINPNVRIGGLTATPYRLDKGLICRPDAILNHICHETGIKDLINQGYLCPLKSRAGKQSADLSKAHVRGGEFVPDEMAEAFDQDGLIDSACREIVELSSARKGILVFCASVEHGQHVQAKLRELGHGAGFVCGETPAGERDQLIGAFKRQELRWLVNVNVLTLGFDAAHVDCIAMLRATLSPGLYYQIVGRGFRIHPGKHDCIVLDYGGNVERHGPVDAIRIKTKKGGTGIEAAPVKTCDQCGYMVHASYASCQHCGFEFPKRELKHGKNADGTPILSGEITDTEFDVRSVRYSLHRKKNDPDAPPTLRVDYSIGWEHFVPEWVCVEHEGFARRKAEQWWKARTTLPFPSSVTEAVAIARAGGLTEPTKITVREISGQQFPRIINPVLGEPFVPGESWETPTFEAAAPKTERAAFNPAGWEWTRDEIEDKPAVNFDLLMNNENEIPF